MSRPFPQLGPEFNFLFTQLIVLCPFGNQDMYCGSALLRPSLRQFVLVVLPVVELRDWFYPFPLFCKGSSTPPIFFSNPKVPVSARFLDEFIFLRAPSLNSSFCAPDFEGFLCPALPFFSMAHRPNASFFRLRRSCALPLRAFLRLVQPGCPLPPCTLA